MAIAEISRNFTTMATSGDHGPIKRIINSTVEVRTIVINDDLTWTKGKIKWDGEASLQGMNFFLAF